MRIAKKPIWLHWLLRPPCPREMDLWRRRGPHPPCPRIRPRPQLLHLGRDGLVHFFKRYRFCCLRRCERRPEDQRCRFRGIITRPECLLPIHRLADPRRTGRLALSPVPTKRRRDPRDGSNALSAERVPDGGLGNAILDPLGVADEEVAVLPGEGVARGESRWGGRVRGEEV